MMILIESVAWIAMILGVVLATYAAQLVDYRAAARHERETALARARAAYIVRRSGEPMRRVSERLPAVPRSAVVAVDGRRRRVPVPAHRTA